MALNALRDQAARQGYFSEAEIEAEIRAVRAEKIDVLLALNDGFNGPQDKDEEKRQDCYPDNRRLQESVAVVTQKLSSPMTGKDED